MKKYEKKRIKKRFKINPQVNLNYFIHLMEFKIKVKNSTKFILLKSYWLPFSINMNFILQYIIITIGDINTMFILL